jgi:hypothetical protein
VNELEDGARLPSALMRDLCETFGAPDMVRAAFAKARSPGAAGKRAGLGSGEGSLMTILMMDLSRVCPGFAMSFGASLGLCGGATMARGTQAQREQFALPVMTMEKPRRERPGTRNCFRSAAGPMRYRSFDRPRGPFGFHVTAGTLPASENRRVL